MSFRIVEMKDLSGAKAHIYSVKFDGYDETLLDCFLMRMKTIRIYKRCSVK